MLSVTTPATVTALTTVDNVKAALNISGTSEDTYLETVIDRVSDAICSYLNIRRADDGTRTLGREVLSEIFRPDGCPSVLILSRAPVVSVASVTVDGTTLETTAYEAEKGPGLLYRLRCESRGQWIGCKITVAYTAGWLLPGEEGRTLPHDIEAAAIDWIKAERSARTRDPLVKREEIPDVLTTDFWVGAIGQGGGIAPDIRAKLDRYRRLDR